MALTKKMLRAKAAGIYTGLSRYRPEDLQNQPKGDLGKDYNRLRSAVQSTIPELESLLPPEVRIYPNYKDEDYSDTTLGELLLYVTQIVNLLEDD